MMLTLKRLFIWKEKKNWKKCTQVEGTCVQEIACVEVRSDMIAGITSCQAPNSKETEIKKIGCTIY